LLRKNEILQQKLAQSTDTEILENEGSIESDHAPLTNEEAVEFEPLNSDDEHEIDVAD